MVAVDHVRWHSRPALDRPVLVAAFEGWNDAGDAASGAVRYLIDRYNGELVAEIDPEEFFDFTSTRPQAEIDEEGLRHIVWPTTSIYSATLPGDAGDALLLIGTEPQLRWRTFCAQITGLAQEMGCRLVVILGALVAEVPHSRPVPVVGTVSDPALQADLGLRPSTYQGRRPVRGLPGGGPRRRLAVGGRAHLRPHGAVPQGGARAAGADLRGPGHVGADDRPRDRGRGLRAPGHRAGAGGRRDVRLRVPARTAPRRRRRR